MITTTEPYCPDCGRPHPPNHLHTVHPQVLLRVGDRTANVDAGIRPLIRELWRAGIDTTMSCQQDGYGCVWVQLPPADAGRFLSIVVGTRPDDRGDLDPNGIYNRITGSWELDDPSAAWRLDAAPHDFAYAGMPAEIEIAVSVRFPPSDLDAVLDRLRSHNGDLDESDALLEQLAAALRMHEFDAQALAALTGRHVEAGMELLARHDLADEIEGLIDWLPPGGTSA